MCRSIKVALAISVTLTLLGCVPPSGTAAKDGSTSSKSLTAHKYDLSDVTAATPTWNLSAHYTAYKFPDNSVKVLERSTGQLHEMEGVAYEEMQVDRTNLYCLNSEEHEIYRMDLMNPKFQIFDVNDVSQTTEGTHMSTEVWSALNSGSSPFRFLGFNQAGSSASTPSPTFVFLNNAGRSVVAAFAGPGGGRRVELFDEGAHQYDCQNSNIFSNIGGGVSGGVMQFSDKALYQVQIGNSVNCSLPGVANCGDALVKMDIDPVTFCAGSTVVTKLNNVSKFAGKPTIAATVSYQLNIVDRYILNPSGFLHTQDDGHGSVAMTWTDLDLSSLPTDNSGAVLINGSTVYWIAGNLIMSQNLVAGSHAGTYYTSPQKIVSVSFSQGQLIVK